MARYIQLVGQALYVDSLHILSMCHKLVREVVGIQANGQGTSDNPYTMSLPAQWITRWRESSREKVVYYKLAGRLIRKTDDLYVSDIGPAYLKGATAEDSANKAGAQRLKDTRPTDGPYKPTATFDEQAKQAWLKRNSIDSPTYRFGAQRIVDPGLIYEDSTAELQRMGGRRPTPWNEIRYSPNLARSIRTFLRGEKLGLADNVGKYDRQYSRKQALLPVFTMAIFHAEPARNERAWPINLMLLDLAERGTANFMWDAILWHPEAINPLPDRRVQAQVIGPAGKNPNQRNLVEITDTDDLHLVGGILPASPTGGGRYGNNELYQNPRPISDKARQYGAEQKPGTFSKIPFDFIHQKEIDVLLKWLFLFPDVRNSWVLVEGNASPQGAQLAKAPEVLAALILNNGPATHGLQNIRGKIRQRIATLNAM